MNNIYAKITVYITLAFVVLIGSVGDSYSIGTTNLQPSAPIRCKDSEGCPSADNSKSGGGPGNVGITSKSLTTDAVKGFSVGNLCELFPTNLLCILKSCAEDPGPSCCVLVPQIEECCEIVKCIKAVTQTIARTETFAVATGSASQSCTDLAQNGSPAAGSTAAVAANPVDNTDCSTMASTADATAGNTRIDCEADCTFRFPYDPPPPSGTSAAAAYDPGPKMSYDACMSVCQSMATPAQVSSTTALNDCNTTKTTTNAANARAVQDCGESRGYATKADAMSAAKSCCGTLKFITDFPACGALECYNDIMDGKPLTLNCCKAMQGINKEASDKCASLMACYKNPTKDCCAFFGDVLGSAVEEKCTQIVDCATTTIPGIVQYFIDIGYTPGANGEQSVGGPSIPLPDAKCCKLIGSADGDAKQMCEDILGCATKLQKGKLDIACCKPFRAIFPECEAVFSCVAKLDNAWTTGNWLQMDTCCQLLPASEDPNKMGINEKCSSIARCARALNSSRANPFLAAECCKTLKDMGVLASNDPRCENILSCLGSSKYMGTPLVTSGATAAVENATRDCDAEANATGYPKPNPEKPDAYSDKKWNDAFDACKSSAGINVKQLKIDSGCCALIPSNKGTRLCNKIRECMAKPTAVDCCESFIPDNPACKILQCASDFSDQATQYANVMSSILSFASPPDCAQVATNAGHLFPSPAWEAAYATCKDENDTTLREFVSNLPKPSPTCCSLYPRSDISKVCRAIDCIKDAAEGRIPRASCCGFLPDTPVSPGESLRAKCIATITCVKAIQRTINPPPGDDCLRSGVSSTAAALADPSGPTSCMNNALACCDTLGAYGINFPQCKNIMECAVNTGKISHTYVNGRRTDATKGIGDTEFAISPKCCNLMEPVLHMEDGSDARCLAIMECVSGMDQFVQNNYTKLQNVKRDGGALDIVAGSIAPLSTCCDTFFPGKPQCSLLKCIGAIAVDYPNLRNPGYTDKAGAANRIANVCCGSIVDNIKHEGTKKAVQKICKWANCISDPSKASCCTQGLIDPDSTVCAGITWCGGTATIVP